jgi:endonuclease/exonuclease/phosphatase (EEP) superfamily protein YafD
MRTRRTRLQLILIPMELRILTANLYNGRADPASLDAALRATKPDVVCAQELAPNAAEVLAEWATTSLLDPRLDNTGMGVAVCGGATFERLSFPYRRPVLARLPAAEWSSSTDLEIINAHLVNPISKPMRSSLQLRKDELVALEKILGNGEVNGARALVGDLNSSPAWPLYRRLRLLATDAALAAGTARRSWGPWPGSPRLLRIDHCFVQGLEPRLTRLLAIRGADHSGLLIDLETPD